MPDVLATDPAFATDRQTIRALVARGKKEAESENQVSIETLRSFRAAVKALQDSVALESAWRSASSWEELLSGYDLAVNHAQGVELASDGHPARV